MKTDAGSMPAPLAMPKRMRSGNRSANVEVKSRRSSLVLERTMRLLLGLFIALSVIGTLAPARAGSLEDGMKAYQQKNYAKAFTLLKPMAEGGHAAAQYAVGRMYEDGFGTKRDYADAAKWYRLSAEQGNAQAQHALGVLYSVGWGVDRDAAEAVKWLRKSAEQGYYYAANDLASRYEAGRGVPKDYPRAYMWFDLGASSAPSAVVSVLTKSRDDVAKKMSAAEIASAKELIAKCRASNLKMCD
jgi:TPR repeat protein